ncbi:MAG TPA: protein kinase [Thermoanaerobaculia bacterium]
MSLVPGGRLGPYEIVGRLGAGGMGEVWRARDTRLDRQVAIKVLPAELSANAQFRLRLEREARLISQLNHPNICILHDVGHDDSRDFLVMEFVEGETLAERLTRGKLPIEQVVRYGVEIADALDRAHKQGIVHRDLKPSNVMLTKSGVKLLDFGLAKSSSGVFSDASQTALATQHKDHSLTAEGTIVGTFQYMAPEQLEGLDADPRTDIFALGCVLYEMATGRRAFEGKTRTSLIAAIVGSTPRPISESEPLTPPALDHIVRKCLEKDPDRRWQSAHDIAGQLRWIEEAGSQAGAPATVVHHRRVRERVAWSLAAALAIALAVVGVAAWMRPRVEPVHARFGVLPPPNVTWTSFNSFAISPDGQYLVFFGAEQNPEGRLYLRKIDSLEIVPLPGTEGASFPFWSPDSRSFAFFVLGKLKRMDVAGRSPETICDAPDGRGGSWNEDGVIVFNGEPGGAIQRVAAVGGIPTPVLTLDTSEKELSQRFPKFLPDGRHFIYRSDREKGTAIYVAAIEGKEPPRKIANASSAEFAPPDRLLLFREGTAFVRRIDPRSGDPVGDPVPIVENVGYNSATGYAAVSASHTGVLAFRARAGGARNRLAWFDRAGREIGELAEEAFYADPAISPDGKRVAVAMPSLEDANKSDIWIIDVARGTRSRLTFDSGVEGGPLWSPDGSTIVYSAGENGSFRIMRKIASGASDATMLLAAAPGQFASDWSRDGRHLAFESGVTQSDLNVADLDGGKARGRTLRGTPFNEWGTRFSPDGRWIAYVSHEGGGRPDVFVETFPASGGRWQISTTGGAFPRWRGDGKELFYLDSQFRMVSVTLTPAENTLEASVPEILFQASVGGQYLDWAHYDVTADGQRFLVDAPAEAASTSPITVVLGWSPPFEK